MSHGALNESVISFTIFMTRVFHNGIHFFDRPVLQPVLGGVHPVTRGSTFAGTAPGEQLPASPGSVMTTLRCRISSSSHSSRLGQ